MAHRCVDDVLQGEFTPHQLVLYVRIGHVGQGVRPPDGVDPDVDALSMERADAVRREHARLFVSRNVSIEIVRSTDGASHDEDRRRKSIGFQQRKSMHQIVVISAVKRDGDESAVVVRIVQL